MKNSLITVLLIAIIALAPFEHLHAAKDPACLQGCENTLNLNIGLCTLGLAAGVAACALVCVDTLGVGCAACISGINIAYVGCLASATVSYTDCCNACPEIPAPSPTPTE